MSREKGLDRFFAEGIAEVGSPVERGQPMKLRTFIAVLVVAWPTFARDPWTGIADSGNLARARGGRLMQIVGCTGVAARR
jgi:hypothetical protein